MKKLFTLLFALVATSALWAEKVDGNITYELNGGVTNDYGWQTKNDMFQACMADCGVTGFATLDEVKASADPIITICSKLFDVTGMLNDEKWDWLEAYIMTVQNADANATALVEGTSSAGWRFALAAFFIEGHRTSWPKSTDFSVAGTPEAFIPSWKHAFANPTEPTAEFVLNAPYKKGKTFGGWYATPDFSGDKVTTVNAETTGTLYAKWIEYIPTIAEVRALADDTETKVAGVVNHVDGKNIYIQDYTGGILVCANESATCKVGDKIVAKGVKVIYGGAPEVKSAVIESAETGKLYNIVAYENLAALVADSLEHKYFATRVTVLGLRIVSYDSFNCPTVEDALGNQAVCYKMVLDPTAFPVGCKVSVTAIAAWFNEFQFVGNAADIVHPIVGKKENYTYPTRHDGKYALENNWVISNVEDNFAANKPGSTDYVRGMAAKDGIMYFINRETESLVRVDGETGKMLEPLKLQGEHLFEVQEEDGTWKSGVTLPFNDIKFDQAGNCLIGASMTGATKCQTFFIYVVDLETGACTKLIEDVLWENPGLNEVKFRFDAFGVAGDVTKNGVIMAADANGSWNVYRWLITDGVAGEGEQVAVLLDPAVDQSLFVNVAGFGSNPQIFPQDEEGSLFYVDGFNTLPMLFYGKPKKRAFLIDDFINVPSGTKVWNNAGDTISMNQGHNGLVEFQVGEEYFLLMAATNIVGSPTSAFALYKFADADREFAGMEPLWYFPHNGLGSTTNGCRVAVPSVDVVSDTEATLYIYTNNNGYASYTFNVQPSTHTLTVKSNNSSMGTVSESGVYEEGENVQISATAHYGYYFSHWNDGNTQNPRTVKVTEDKTYTAYFEKNTYNIAKQYDAQQGSISGSTSGKYLDVISLTAIPNTGYHFSQWHDGVTDNPRSFVLTQDTTFAAFFAVNHYQLNISTNNPDAGTVSGAGTYEYGTYTEISATANYGYHFSHWNDYNYDNPRQVQVTEDKTYTAYFDKNTYYITKNYDSNQGYVDGYSSGEYLDNITLTAEANYGYHFVKWSDGNTSNPHHFILTQDTTFSAEFAQTFSGQCGDNLYWSYQNNTLTISGFGGMYDNRPWGLFTNEIQTVVLPNGITHIGNDAFSDCIGLNEITIPYTVTSIGDYAFAGCRKLVHVNCYAINPPMAENTSFANYNVYLNVPCDNLQDYQLDMVFGSFKYIQCMGADSENAPTDDVVVTPGTTDVTITWPTDESADTYTIEIKRGDQVFCTLTFSKEGQLMNIAFISGRDGQNRAQYAESTTQGLRFTITSLDSGTQYSYDITTRDENNDVIDSYTGEFTTQSDVTTNIDNVPSTNPRVQKILLNGQLYILREGKTYSVLGQEM